VGRSISSSPYRYIARVRYHAPKEVVAQRFSPAAATVEADGPDACIVTAGADDPERMVLYFATVGHEFQVIEPPEVVAAVGAVATRLQAAAHRN
jgi:predicted DNA-binding transcriptional regulator YafY